MVFPSLPLYLDPPNWNQQSNQQIQGHIGNNNNDQNQHLFVPPPQQQPPPHHMAIMGGGGAGVGLHGAQHIRPQQIRPNSMAEHARQLKIPPPEGPLKCPRCQSTNTKFCYYNNYNLTQPRHLCKTCRRYWTHGGALRNVPVGGGCRKNKRSSSKSSSGGGPSSSKLALSTSSVGVNITSPTNVHSGGANSMPFMTSNLQNIGYLGGTMMSGMGHTFTGGPIHTNPPGIVTPEGLVRGVEENNRRQNHGFPQYVHQFPNFLGGFQIPESSSGGGAGEGEGLYSSSFQNVRHYNNQGVGIGDGGDDNNQENQQQIMEDNMGKVSSADMKSEVKMEVNRQQGHNNNNNNNLADEVMIRGVITSSADNNFTNSRNNNGDSNSNNQYWGGNMMNVTSPWTNISGLNSSSTSHLL